MGCHALFQGIFPTQGWNPLLLGLLCWQVASLPLAPPGKPEPSTWVQHQKCQGDLNSSVSLLPRPLIRRWRPKCRTPSSAVLTVSESLPHTGLPLPPPPPPLHWPRIHFHPTVTPAPHCHSTALLKSLFFFIFLFFYFFILFKLDPIVFKFRYPQGLSPAYEIMSGSLCLLSVLHSLAFSGLSTICPSHRLSRTEMCLPAPVTHFTV